MRKLSTFGGTDGLLLRNFKQLFARGQEFTYQLEDIARYYRTYLELMRHWDRVLPGRVLRIHYEDVVEDLETNVRRLLDYCGLGFESGCIEFHRTARNVQTASAEQVRRPIYREGLEHGVTLNPGSPHCVNHWVMRSADFASSRRPWPQHSGTFTARPPARSPCRSRTCRDLSGAWWQ